MIVREENCDDVAAVRHIVIAAFGQEDEADLVDGLRASEDAVISLVAEENGEIVGHVLFSKLVAPEQCIALAPVSVTPARQKQEIGSRLIREGLDRARKDGWHGAFVLGEPGYYTRFGFELSAAEKFETEYPQAYFMALSLTENALDEKIGAVIYAPPFHQL